MFDRKQADVSFNRISNLAAQEIGRFLIEESSFETFTGKWAKEKGFKKATWRNIGDLQRDKTIIKFIK